ncbi:hypothetical protein Tco_0789030 [Tanacetum coccineum]
MTLEEYARYEVERSSKKVDITDYEDSDHEDGELPDLHIFSATYEFASVCEQVEENISIAEEEVHMEDVKMDENHDIDH